MTTETISATTTVPASMGAVFAVLTEPAGCASHETPTD